MQADFDMNGNQILNLPEPVDPTNPVRLQDIDDYLATAAQVAEDSQAAQDAAAAALTSENAAEAAEVSAQSESNTAEQARIFAQQYAADAAMVSGVNVPIYASIASAQSAFIAAGVQCIETQFYAPNYAIPSTLVGRRRQVRMSLADITAGGYPAASYFRSTDRYMPDGSIDAVNGGYWLLQPDAAGVYELESFGISAASSSAQVAAAIEGALGMLQDGQSLVQRGPLYTADAVSAFLTVSRVTIRLNLKFSKNIADAAFYISGATYSVIDVSVNGDAGDCVGLWLEGCTGSVIPKSATIQNISAVTLLGVGVFLRDCAGMEVLCTVKDITGNGSHAVRGVMISDQTISSNTSLISPTVSNITVTAGAYDDADGIYAENSLSGHYGGLRVVGGEYINCQKRNIKVSSARPEIFDNKGVNSLLVDMYAFVSSYNKLSGIIRDNSFEKTGPNGTYIAYDAGSTTTTDYSSAQIRSNRGASETVIASSKGIALNSAARMVCIADNDISGFSVYAQSYGAAATVGQVLDVINGRFDNLSYGSSGNCMQFTGDFSHLRVTGPVCINAVASKYFLSAPNISAGILEILGVKQSYSYGLFTANRPLTAYDTSFGTSNSVRYEGGLKIEKRTSAPASGAHIVGDRWEQFTPAAGGVTGGSCVTAGTPGTFKDAGTFAA